MRQWTARLALSITCALALAMLSVVASELVPIRRNLGMNQFGGGAARQKLRRELSEEEVLAQVEEQTGPLTSTLKRPLLTSALLIDCRKEEADDQVNSLTGNIDKHNMVLVWCAVGGNAAVAVGLLLWRKSQGSEESSKGGSFLQIINNYVKPGIPAASKSKRKRKDKKSKAFSEKSSAAPYRSSGAGSIKSAKSAIGPSSSIRSANSKSGGINSTQTKGKRSKQSKAGIAKAMSRFNQPAIQ